MLNPEIIRLEDYSYPLPEDRIAQIPLEKRDNAKLLHYKNGDISHQKFYDLADFLPENSLLVFNNTKVIPARLFFQKASNNSNKENNKSISGAIIEVFLLSPKLPSTVMSLVMQETKSCVWFCMIGNKKRWKEDLFQEIIIENIIATTPNPSFEGGEQTPLLFKEGLGVVNNFQKIILKARLIDVESSLVELSWENENINFATILAYLGQMPLPPYIKRKADKTDDNRYQTVYSDKKGAVAAPTAGLHFTEDVFDKLESKNIAKEFVTLHVSAGTFQPIKVSNILEHTMQKEQIVITKKNIENLLQATENQKVITVVGTTSMRTLESLYWFGVKLFLSQNASQNTHQNIENELFFIEKLYPYQILEKIGESALPSRKQSFEAILGYINALQKTEIIGETEIFIFPSYKFRVCDALVTNFHMPNTTLILLVAAFVGKDWFDIYQSALDNDYRFLSYGDSSLLIRNNFEF